MELYPKNGSVLYILNILKKYSGEDNLLSSNKISRLIEEEYNVKIEPRKIRRDINLLIEVFGYDIEKYDQNNVGYMIRRDPDNEFELGELDIIINTFAYSNFIPENISNNIIKKCLSKMNVYEQKRYENYKAAIKNTKTRNQEVIKNIEDINEAINKKRKISFDYYKYTIEDNKIIEKKEIPLYPYKVSPYKISYNLQKLYLFCKKDGIKKVLKYRLDRMKNIKILEERVNAKYTESYIDSEIENNVSMYTGDLEKVEIECNISMLDTIIETFGKNIKINKIDDNSFKAEFYTVLEGFKYFCLRNIETVKVVKPESLKNKIIKILKENVK